jgi:hypothetical protein
MLRRTRLVLVPFILVALVVGIPTAASDTNLQNVTLSCSDETNLGLTLSSTAVTDLTNATTAMTLFPAGLSCGVSTQSDPPAGGNPAYDYAVGGGDQFFIQPSLAAPCQHNFGFSMRSLSNTTVGSGSYRETVPGGCAGFGETGQLMVDITCLQVTANGFNANGTVTKATGQFVTGFPTFTTGHAYISGHDAGGAPADTLRVDPNPGVNGACQGPAGEPATSHGRINVNDAD